MHTAARASKYLKNLASTFDMSYEDYEVHRRSIGSLLDETHAYKIPAYQRSYSWDVDNATQLFEDLTKTADADIGSASSSNLLGAMVVVPQGSGSPKFEVVDGQQRLATMALILCSMRSCLYKFRGNELPGTRPALDNVVTTIDSMLNVKPGEPRIELGKDDYGLFRDLLSTNTHDYASRCRELLVKYKNSKKRILDSNKLLINNYCVLSELTEKKISKFGLDAAFDNRKTDEFSEAANTLSRYLAQNMVKRNHFAFIVVHNRYSAYKIFTTFNSKGQKLMYADLIKSHLLSITKSMDENERMERRWREIFDERLEDHDRFLYESTSSRHPSGRYKDIPITTENLYQIVESAVTNAREAETYIERLEEDARIVKLMDYPEDLPEDDKFEKTQSIFYLMQLLGARYIRVPMLAAGRKWDLGRSEFQTLADCLLTFFFKFKFINDGTAEDVRSIANQVTKKLEGDASLSEMIYLILVNKDVAGSPSLRINEAKFKDNFRGKMFKITPKAAKYVLSSMEIYLNREKPHPYPKHTFELEHILPKNHQKWNESAFLGENPEDDDINKYKNRLGNLTILSRKWNRGMGAKCFSEKLKGYKSSEIELNEKYLNHYGEWTEGKLKEREDRLCELALETWSLSQHDQYLRKHGYPGV